MPKSGSALHITGSNSLVLNKPFFALHMTQMNTTNTTVKYMSQSNHTNVSLITINKNEKSYRK
jgi:hypothetical protein